MDKSLRGACAYRWEDGDGQAVKTAHRFKKKKKKRQKKIMVVRFYGMFSLKRGWSDVDCNAPHACRVEQSGAEQ